jgi:transposase InsO family protein
MMFPLVRDLAAPTARLRVPVTVTCRVLGFSTQAFYKWLANPVCQRDWDDAHLINAALDLHGDDPEFGYRLLTDELRLKGFAASENRVWRLCSQQRIFSVHSRKRGLNRKPGPPVHDDLLERDFSAETVNSKWLTDITEHPTGEGKLYLCAIKDCASNKIVGYSLDAQMTSELAVTALRNAIALRSPAGTIVHSDRGSQTGLNWSSQHLDRGGADGQASRVDAGVDGPVSNEVARETVSAARRGALVLA